MGRFLFAAIVYIISNNKVPIKTFDNFSDMNRWTRDYKLNQIYEPTQTRPLIEVHACVTHDLIGQKCNLYSTF